MRRTSQVPPGFRPVPRTGVIYVTTEAAKHGYQPGHPEWANLGQGAPETGPLPGAPPRQEAIPLSEETFEYSPIDGLPELRERVAALHNVRHRVGKRRQYTAANVAISPGGRAALTRGVHPWPDQRGALLPDYTAYEELLDSFGTFVPIPLIRRPEAEYAFPAEELRNEVLGRGLSTVVLSNPPNPIRACAATPHSVTGPVDPQPSLRAAGSGSESYPSALPGARRRGSFPLGRGCGCFSARSRDSHARAPAYGASNEREGRG